MCGFFSTVVVATVRMVRFDVQTGWIRTGENVLVHRGSEY